MDMYITLHYLVIFALAVCGGLVSFLGFNAYHRQRLLLARQGSLIELMHTNTKLMQTKEEMMRKLLLHYQEQSSERVSESELLKSGRVKISLN